MPEAADRVSLGDWAGGVLDHAAHRIGSDAVPAVAGPFPLRVRDETLQEDAGRLDPRAVRPSTSDGRTVTALDVSLQGAPAAGRELVRPHARTHFQCGAVQALIEPFGVGWALDSERAVACRLALGAELPDSEHVTPLRPILTWWAAVHGLALVHAAAVSTGGAAILVAGPPAAGKSTFALAWAQADGDVLGDDYCIVDPGPPPIVHALYGYAKASPSSLTLSGYPRPAGPPLTSNGKHVIALPTVTTPMPLVAVCVLERASEPPLSHVRAVSPAVAVRALAPSTLAQQVGSWDETWRAMTTIARAVPAMTARVGPDLAAAVAAVRAAACA